MKVFIVGQPKSGRTTVAQQLGRSLHGIDGADWFYVNTMDWVKNTFRAPNQNEKGHQYIEECHNYLLNRLQINPNLITDNFSESIKAIDKIKISGLNYNLVVDGVLNPRDFCQVFDYNKDMVVFLNRTDNDSDIQDYESIGVSVIRDYCFWLASANLLSKPQWIEYNFKMTGDDSDFVRELGSKNSIYIIKSIGRVISHLINLVGSKNDFSR
jgi:hypothetical protein